MPVIFKGGSSGMSQDYKASSPAMVPQPVLNTASMTSSENGVYWYGSEVKRPSASTATPDFMPVCCTEAPANSTDIQQQDISGI